LILVFWCSAHDPTFVGDMLAAYMTSVQVRICRMQGLCLGMIGGISAADGWMRWIRLSGGLVACLIKASRSQLTATPRRLPPLSSDLGDNASLASLPFPLRTVSLINHSPTVESMSQPVLASQRRFPATLLLSPYLTVNHAHNYLGPLAGGRPPPTVWESSAPPGMTINDHH
jgi:hypothetical protein